MMQGSATAARAPAVVVVVVTTDPGPWFDETLAALAAQDYESLSVLVLVSGGTADPTPTIATVLPEAFVRRLPENRGFGAAVGEALSMVEGAPFFLLCHDDCAPTPDALHLMVEESFRSNAGIVSPKMVCWDDPLLLMHVGQSIDKTGAVVERVQDGEIDAGQHDAVRDVFVAPGGCTLVRADLLRALGGYDPDVAGMGEDVDLSWRAHIAGARVVVAPAAKVRHLSLTAGGGRAPMPADAPSLQALQRRNELAAVLACYTRAHLLRVLPQAMLLALGELLVAVVTGDGNRARAVLHAWRWNLANFARVRRRRAGVRAVRVLADADVRELQVRGSARLSGFFARLTAHGMEAARARRDADHDPVGAPASDAGVGDAQTAYPATARATVEDAVARTIGEAQRTARIGFAEDADFDELDDFGYRAAERAHRTGRLFASRRSRIVAWLLVAAVLVVGSRHLIGDPLPLIGQFAPFGTWTSAWHQLFASWEPTGLGTTAPASPAFGVLAVLGTVVFGRMGLLQEVLVLGCFPVGVWGVSRLLGAFGSVRARFVGALAYLALPLAYDALARGRFDGLVAYAATPWLAVHLARATGLAPFDADGLGPSHGWRQTLIGRMLVVGAIEGVAMSFAPGIVLVVVLVALGIASGSLVTGGSRSAWRALAVAGGATLVACVLCAPWVIGTLGTGGAVVSVFGLPASASAEPGWGGILRLAVGPYGASPLAWLLLAAAFAPLLVARQSRLAWAVRLWVVALGGALVAFVGAKGLAGAFAPSVAVVLAPVALGIAGCVGIGVAALERDLSDFRFGWRQVLAPVTVCAIALGMLPALAAAGSGRRDLPSVGYAGAAQLPPVGPRLPAYRVLWIGNPAALPAGGWSMGDGLAFTITLDGTPQLGDVWPQASPGKARTIARDVRLAMRGETVQLGRLLAPFGVRDTVVVRALAPQTPGAGSSPTLPLPSGLLDALMRQGDFRTVPLSVGGLVELQNTAFGASAARHLAAPPVVSTTATLLDALGGALELALWVALVAAFLGRRRCLDWWWRPLRSWQRGRRRPRAGSAVEASPARLASGHAPDEAVVLTDAVLPSPAPAGDNR
jgi:GT2 family glycosyltransferase